MYKSQELCNSWLPLLRPRAEFFARVADLLRLQSVVGRRRCSLHDWPTVRVCARSQIDPRCKFISCSRDKSSSSSSSTESRSRSWRSLHIYLKINKQLTGNVRHRSVREGRSWNWTLAQMTPDVLRILLALLSSFMCRLKQHLARDQNQVKELIDSRLSWFWKQQQQVGRLCNFIALTSWPIIDSQRKTLNVDR